ncbi:CLUMA_CG017836, isoform A [Clunio marinus]|uniref:CLUMA_CG017836, isoform A n=1 Tax=Clunio marinus TaxID=568069 RepID=A0A1J1IZ03_9DIPT|nr:CLUMA_CG017836, isoform A [Clunio marinus]
MMLPVLSVIAVIILFVLAIYRFLGPRVQHSWFFSNGEEKIGLSKDKLYNANGYIVHSGSDILLGSTGSFKRFDSVDRNAHEGELVYGQTALATPPWKTDEAIPPQPLRPAPYQLPLVMKSKNKNQSHSQVSKQESLDPKTVSGPLKSVPRPIPKKQLSAPASTCHIPFINPPEKGFQNSVKNMQTTTTNPFLNGLINFESIKSNFFSTSVTTTTEWKIENERQTKSAFVSKNPFITTSSESDYNNVFDFNPSTIKSIMEETPDEGYLGDNDENDDADPLKQLEERIQKIEASGKQRRKSSGSGTPPRFSPKMLNKSGNGQKSDLNSAHLPEISPNVNEKFVDSSLNEDCLIQSYRKHIRNRSLSENETGELSQHGDYDDQLSPIIIAPPSTTNPFLNGKRLLKTPSETYLEQYSMMRANKSVNNNIAPIKTMQLCKHPSLNKIIQSSQQTLLENSDSCQNMSTMKRALSSESISSESSVVMSTLERTIPPVTGNLCIALQYDKHTATEEGCELLCTILEAKDLIIPADADPDHVDTFVRVYLVPDEAEAMQTKIFKSSRHPSYQELFAFFITKQNIKRSLWFHLYHTNVQCTTLIGETEMKLTEIRKPLTTWLQLSDSRNNCTSWGDLMFSLSYLPTAERLTVVVVKARNLRPEIDEHEGRRDVKTDIQNVFVKVYLLKNDRKVSKKRTSTKRGEINPVFNEAMMFSVPPYMLNSIQVRLTVMNTQSPSDSYESHRKSLPVGHVIVGSRTDGKGLLHWHQMITSLRKPIAMFHPLRRSTKKTSTC